MELMRRPSTKLDFQGVLFRSFLYPIYWITNITGTTEITGTTGTTQYLCDLQPPGSSRISGRRISVVPVVPVYWGGTTGGQLHHVHDQHIPKLQIYLEEI